MARLFNRKRKDEQPPRAEESEAEGVPLDGDEHAWWAQQEVSQVWRPVSPARKPPRKKAGKATGGATGKADAATDDDDRDILAEHFGEDWRTSFEYRGPSEEELEEERRREQQAADDEDPYKVLAVQPTATWEEIVEAHRTMARTHHPDRLVGQSEEEQAAGEERIRVINMAYQELRIRRGK